MHNSCGFLNLCLLLTNPTRTEAIYLCYFDSQECSLTKSSSEWIVLSMLFFPLPFLVNTLPWESYIFSLSLSIWITLLYIENTMSFCILSFWILVLTLNVRLCVINLLQRLWLFFIKVDINSYLMIVPTLNDILLHHTPWATVHFLILHHVFFFLTNKVYGYVSFWVIGAVSSPRALTGF